MNTLSIRHLFLISLVFITTKCQNNYKSTTFSGNALGTTYTIKHDSPISNDVLIFDINKILEKINQSMSTYHLDSDISKINNGYQISVDSYFKEVYLKALEVWNQTNGAFDPTVGSLVNAYGFGPNKNNINSLSDIKIDSLLELTGFDKINGVSFSKGCFIGQEVTARMRHKTTLKNGLVKLQTFKIPLKPNTQITNEKGQLAGHVSSSINKKGLGIIKFIYAKSGRSPGEGASLPAPDSIGAIEVDFLPWNKRGPSLEIIDEITERTKPIPGIEAIIKKDSKGPQLGQAIQIEVSSKNDNDLLETVSLIRQGMEELGGFVSKSDNRPLPGIEWQLRVDRSEASKFNADIATIGQSVQLITKGLKLAEYRPDDSEEIAIKRYKTYEKSTEPVIEYYKKLNLLKVIDGERSIDQINKEISDIISLI